MSYACIDRDELSRRGLCEDAPAPSIIHETLLEPIFESDPFVPPSMRSRGGRFGGGSRFGGGGRRGARWQPRHQQVLRSVASGSGDGPSTSIMQPRGNPYGRAGAPTAAMPSGPVSSSPYTSGGYRASPTRAVTGTGYTTRQTAVPGGSISRGNQYQAAPSQASMPRGMKGLGQAFDGVSPRWKWATLGLVGFAIAQFLWWNAKAPQVLGGKGY